MVFWLNKFFEFWEPCFGRLFTQNIPNTSSLFDIMCIFMLMGLCILPLWATGRFIR